MNVPSKETEFYARKAVEHLLRQLAIYEAADRGLVDTINRRGDSYLELFGTTVDLPEASSAKNRASKAALVGMKTEFELFMKILTAKFVSRAIEATQKNGDPPKGMTELLTDNRSLKGWTQRCIESGFVDPIEAFMSHAVPRSGLDRYLDVLKKLEVGGLYPTKEDELEYAKRFMSDSGRVWNQIRAAFFVRHAIEHSHGQITQRETLALDTKKTAPKTHLMASTWRRLLTRFDHREFVSVEVEKADIIGTAVAMAISVRRMAAAYEEYDNKLTPT